MTRPDPAAALRAELATLTTEARNTDVADLAALGTADLVAAMNRMDAEVAAAVGRALPTLADCIDATAERMSSGGRLIYIGAGTPGRLGVLDASECPPTFGTDPGQVIGVIAGGEPALRVAVENAEDDRDAGAADLAALSIGARDTVVGISASGRTPYVLAAIDYARAHGAFTIGFSCNAASPLGSAADIALEIDVGPELLTGSTRLKAGTAQKLVLNMISTITMVRLGKTYKNLMVDLRATNRKLLARSERTVMAATGCGAAAASEALAESAGSVKLAILMLLVGLDATAAADLLGRSGGHLQRAVDGA